MAVDGNWNITMSTPMGERNATLTLKNAGGALTGTQGADGNSTEIFDGTASGDDVAWKVSITNPMPLTLAFTGKVSGDSISVCNGRIRVTAIKDPATLPWKGLGVDVALECTGIFTSKEKASAHLKAGADRVLVSAPADGADLTVVYGVNHEKLTKEHKVVSNASCTTNCLAPVAKVLHDAVGIEKGFMTTVHAYTNDQRLADVPHKDLRRSRAAPENIIPTTTGAARAVGKILPQLKGRLDGMAIRVPVPDGSIVDLSVRLRQKPSVRDVNAAVRAAAEGEMKRIVEYSEVPLVSSDIIGNPNSSIFDALSTASMGDGYVKVVSWYDNEWGYSNRVVDLMDRLAALG